MLSCLVPCLSAFIHSALLGNALGPPFHCPNGIKYLRGWGMKRPRHLRHLTIKCRSLRRTAFWVPLWDSGEWPIGRITTTITVRHNSLQPQVSYERIGLIVRLQPVGDGCHTQSRVFSGGLRGSQVLQESLEADCSTFPPDVICWMVRVCVAIESQHVRSVHPPVSRCLCPLPKCQRTAAMTGAALPEYSAPCPAQSAVPRSSE
jgi:hypothetical protein